MLPLWNSTHRTPYANQVSSTDPGYPAGNLDRAYHPAAQPAWAVTEVFTGCFKDKLDIWPFSQMKTKFDWFCISMDGAATTETFPSPLAGFAGQSNFILFPAGKYWCFLSYPHRSPCQYSCTDHHIITHTLCSSFSSSSYLLSNY